MPCAIIRMARSLHRVCTTSIQTTREQRGQAPLLLDFWHHWRRTPSLFMLATPRPFVFRPTPLPVDEVLVAIENLTATAKLPATPSLLLVRPCTLPISKICITIEGLLDPGLVAASACVGTTPSHLRIGPFPLPIRVPDLAVFSAGGRHRWSHGVCRSCHDAARHVQRARLAHGTHLNRQNIRMLARVRICGRNMIRHGLYMRRARA